MPARRRRADGPRRVRRGSGRPGRSRPRARRRRATNIVMRAVEVGAPADGPDPSAAEVRRRTIHAPSPTATRRPSTTTADARAPGTSSTPSGRDEGERPAARGRRHDRRREHVGGDLVERRRQPQQLPSPGTCRTITTSATVGSPLGEGPGLVEEQHLCRAASRSSAPPPLTITPRRAHAGQARHDRHRRGEDQRARRRHHQHRHGAHRVAAEPAHASRGDDQADQAGTSRRSGRPGGRTGRSSPGPARRGGRRPA